MEKRERTLMMHAGAAWIFILWVMQMTLISDTHGKHRELRLSGGDVLVHAGDVTGRGTRGEAEDFIAWLNEQPYSSKIFIAGNHDRWFEEANAGEIQALMPENVHYLNDSGCTIDGVKFWGSPVTPWFYHWSFGRRRGPEIQRHWDLVPEGTHVLITHGPPMHLLDRTCDGEHVGCEHLLHCVDHIHPQLHVFGHTHEGYGSLENSGVRFVNASVMDEKYRICNLPFAHFIEPRAALTR